MYKSLKKGKALKEPEMYQHLLPRICIFSKLFLSTTFFFCFFPLHFPFASQYLMNLIPIPAEGNKELHCWSNGLFAALMKYYSQL